MSETNKERKPRSASSKVGMHYGMRVFARLNAGELAMLRAMLDNPTFVDEQVSELRRRVSEFAASQFESQGDKAAVGDTG